ncbi:hypothetical protein RH858_04775 [Halalkaliarchaeum sp. AArc-GB]|uniref:hypothetical protein n=1 Tax=Halalkaliarchaeum sp. AArc-GB TaxID=3074078 RepID=UPI00286394FA|nr:hypothetical protein [Halalkaliarchaeum sp. AArc-GB]MDR5672463.1 hypothetical protein [Halalkaliarchaeum sp. AArc-GB]
MTVARDFFDLRMAGLYLPGLVLLMINPRVPWLSDWYPEFPWLPLIAFFSLLSAVYFHGLSRNVFGPGGPEANPLKRGEVIRGIQVAVTGKGPHTNHPESFVGMMMNFRKNPELLGKKGTVFVFLWVVSFLIWTAAIPFSIYVGATQFESLSVTAQLLLFAEIVWVLQWYVWRYYSPSYLLDRDDFKNS